MCSVVIYYILTSFDKIKLLIICCLVIGCTRPLNKIQEADNLYFSKQNISYYLDAKDIKSKDEEVIANYRQLFKRHTIGNATNISPSVKNILWLSFTLDTVLPNDCLIKFLPRYKRVTFYSFNLDSVLTRQVVGLEVPFNERKLKSNSLLLELNRQTFNIYFIKYEFYDDFLVGAFEIQNYYKVINDNLRNSISYSIIITLILLIFLISLFNFILTFEIRNLFYGLYVLFYGFFAASSYYLWHMVSDTIHISHTIYSYYIPFSLSTCFFALYILYSVSITPKHWATFLLYFMLIAKFLTILLAILDFSDVNWTNIYFTKIDVLIFAVLIYISILNCLKSTSLINFWLLTGVIIIFIAQTVHAFYSISFTSYFMCFDIIWFGIGLAIHQRIIKNEKIDALKEGFDIKSNHNLLLETTVRDRTKLLSQKTEELDRNLRTIAELYEILAINNISLQRNVESLSKDRILNRELSFEEFKLQFPDKNTCLDLLTELKWKLGFVCNNCKGSKYYEIDKEGNTQRKCVQCGKIHSASADTLFHNIKFSLEKAFYITFLTTSNKKYSIEQISDIIDLRKGTVWGFKKKVEERIIEKKFSKTKNMTWQDLIF